jgi:K(+)-stimulated pyrophosphate-energized sodium pump
MSVTLFDAFRVATSFEKAALIVVLVVAVLGLLYAAFLVRQVLREPKGTEKMQKISNAIRTGGNAYLRRQFGTIVWILIILAVLVFFSGYLGNIASAYDNPKWLIGLGRAFGFVMGAGFSALVGYLGMNMAMAANVRVAQASRSSFTKALQIGYRAGTITGMLTDGLGLLGGTIIFLLFFKDAPLVLLGFGFGGTLLALFMRVGGGIYTKAADVGADLVGKVEKGIPEDDPRNAAVIADQVGDNVGDCAGMAADIFESYEVTIVSAMILGLLISNFTGQLYWIIFPLLVRAAGVFSSIISTYSVKASGESQNAMSAIHRGYIIAACISVVSFLLFGWLYCHNLRFFWATSVGVALAVAIQFLTDYYTAPEKSPVQEIAKATKTGPATTILSGIASGYESTVMSVIIIALSILASAIIWQGYGDPEHQLLFIFYGIALCGIGQLTLTGNNIAMDSFGPIVDNANGIGEMSGLEPKSRQILADLDAVGNTTKAVTKGIAIASAVLAAVALFASFYEEYSLPQIDLIQWKVFVAFLIGGGIPFLFSSMAIRAVGRAAYAIVNEVRWQFNNIKGLWEGTAEPDYSKVVNISTSAAQKELVTPALMAIISPIIIGLLLGLEALAGFLAGVILVGQLLAVFMSNAGGAWDNAKKVIEDGLYGGKGSEPHKAAVVGDTVGDPMKDTAGPALNPLIKVINLVALIFASVLAIPGLTRDTFKERDLTPVAVIIGVVGILAIVISFWYSKKQSSFGREEDAEPQQAAPAAKK